MNKIETVWVFVLHPNTPYSNGKTFIRSFPRIKNLHSMITEIQPKFFILHSIEDQVAEFMK